MNARWILPAVCVGLATLVAFPVAYANDSHGNWKSAPLVKLVREATGQYRDVEVALDDGYVPDPYCASGENGGAVGIHFVNIDLVDNELNAAEPEVLYYEPLPGGGVRLVGAEYAYFELPFGEPPVTPQHLEGHLLNYMVAPNRFGIGVDWLRLNVWAWKRNPNGTFAGDNPNVSCDAYDPNLHPQP